MLQTTDSSSEQYVFVIDIGKTSIGDVRIDVAQIDISTSPGETKLNCEVDVKGKDGTAAARFNCRRRVPSHLR